MVDDIQAAKDSDVRDLMLLMGDQVDAFELMVIERTMFNAALPTAHHAAELLDKRDHAGKRVARKLIQDMTDDQLNRRAAARRAIFERTAELIEEQRFPDDLAGDELWVEAAHVLYCELGRHQGEMFDTWNDASEEDRAAHEAFVEPVIAVLLAQLPTYAELTAAYQRIERDGRAWRRISQEEYTRRIAETTYHTWPEYIAFQKAEEDFYKLMHRCARDGDLANGDIELNERERPLPLIPPETSVTDAMVRAAQQAHEIHEPEFAMRAAIEAALKEALSTPKLP